MNSTQLQLDSVQPWRIRPVCVLVLAAALLLDPLQSTCVRADDWLTWPSTYTHDPRTGLPTDQYAQPVQPVAPRSDVVRSGYRHFRSTLQVGQSTDNMHIVEQWGQPVVPYEEWRFPYRPFSVPYDAWGPPLGLGGWPFIPGVGFPGAGFPGGGFPGGGFPGGGFPGGGFPGGGFPGGGFPGGGFPGPFPPGGQFPGNPNGGYPNIPGNFWRPGIVPLQPSYQGQPWFDGTYPSAPPLDPRSDQEFFYRPQR